MDELKTLLANNAHRLSVPRLGVFEVLEKAKQPSSLKEIHDALPMIDRASIYRTLQLYQQLRVVEVVHIGWKKRYELAAPFKPHHHHLHCTECGELIDIGTEKLEKLIKAAAHSHGYTLAYHHIELEGICQKCRAK